VSRAASQAGKRGAQSAASILYRWLRRGREGESPAHATLPQPMSTFALYVNTAAVLWLFGFMLVEVWRGWRLPCDVPLHTFVLVAAVLGVAVALADFIADVFRGACAAHPSRARRAPVARASLRAAAARLRCRQPCHAPGVRGASVTRTAYACSQTRCRQ
jgi:hypothetical protein